jgi:REP element-mobilizing transposase RayT
LEEALNLSSDRALNDDVHTTDAPCHLSKSSTAEIHVPYYICTTLLTYHTTFLPHYRHNILLTYHPTDILNQRQNTLLAKLLYYAIILL